MQIKPAMALEVGEALIDAAQCASSKNRPCLVVYNKELKVAYATLDAPTDDEVLYVVPPS